MALIVTICLTYLHLTKQALKVSKIIKFPKAVSKKMATLVETMREFLYLKHFNEPRGQNEPYILALACRSGLVQCMMVY